MCVVVEPNTVSIILYDTHSVQFHRAVATGTIGPVSTGPFFGALCHVFAMKHHVSVTSR